MTTPLEIRSRIRNPVQSGDNARGANEVDLRDLTIVLARAFDDDPFVNWLAVQDDRRRHHIAWLMSYTLRVATFPHGHVYTTPSLEGAACWVPPGVRPPGFFATLPHLRGLIRTMGWRRLGTVSRVLAALEAKHPRVAHYYLATLGVTPESQGCGVGGRLMEPILERCDRQGIPAWLESSKERNVPFYERHGFRVREEYDVTPAGPRLWLMWRDPQ